MHAHSTSRKTKGRALIAGLFGIAAGSSLSGVALADAGQLHGRGAAVGGNTAGTRISLNAPESTSHSHGSGDAALTYTGTAGTGLFSTANNWSPAQVPATGDSLAFGTTPAGNYTVTNDLSATVFGPVTVNRSVATNLITLNGGLSAYTTQITRGALTFNGGTITSNGNFEATQASIDAGFRVGIGTGVAGTLTFQNSAVVNYSTMLYGSGGGNGTVNIQGGTVLTPQAGVTSEFRGGGAGTGTVNITGTGTVVNSNVYLSNLIDTTTIGGGAVLNLADYVEDEIQYGGEAEVGFFTNTSTTVANAQFNVNTGGTVNTTFLQVASGGPGENGTINVNGGVVNSVILGVARASANGTVATPQTYMNGTLNVTNGGVINTPDFLTGYTNTSFATVNITGAGSKINGTEVMFIGGSSSSVGSGTSVINVTGGATLSNGQGQLGSGNATVKAATYAGSTLNVSGTGSTFSLNGIAATPDDPTEFGALLFVGGGIATTSTINVTAGGAVNLLANSSPDADLALNGGLVIGEGTGTTSTVTVDGTGSVFHAGTVIEATQATATTDNFTNSTVVFNVRNGGLLDSVDDAPTDPTSTSGNIQLGIQGVATGTGLPTGTITGATITVNIGGGSGTDDANSAVLADSTIFVGGQGANGATAPNLPSTPGVPTTINVNNGELGGGAILVYAGSNVNLNHGVVDAGLLSARGGKFTINATTAVSTATVPALFEAGVFEATDGGQFDIGKNGGVSFIVSGDTVDDLTRVKSLIVAGYNGGTNDGLNSIRSSVVAANTAGRLGIGYGNTTTLGITSFLGETFGGATDTPAIVFRTTLKGDTNLDATVGFADLLFLAQNYNPAGSGKEWFNGDFNYDGKVDFSDLLSLSQNYGSTFSLVNGSISTDPALHGQFAADWALAQSLVPEPTTLAAVGGLATMALRRRRVAR